MNKHRIWYILPTVLLPYLVLCSLALIFLSTNHPFFRSIMKTVFHSNALYLFAALLIFCILAAILTIVFFFMGLSKGWNPLSMAKTAMIVKLIQVPAYIMIFILGVLLAITVFTIPFSVGLFLVDCLTLFLTGLITSAAVINAVRQSNFSIKETIWVIILQMFFCADVIASIVFYSMLKKAENRN